MWWETLKLMTQESYNVEIDTDKSDTNIPEAKATNNEVGAVEEV